MRSRLRLGSLVKLAVLAAVVLTLSWWTLPDEDDEQRRADYARLVVEGEGARTEAVFDRLRPSVQSTGTRRSRRLVEVQCPVLVYRVEGVERTIDGRGCERDPDDVDTTQRAEVVYDPERPGTAFLDDEESARALTGSVPWVTVVLIGLGSIPALVVLLALGARLVALVRRRPPETPTAAS